MAVVLLVIENKQEFGGLVIQRDETDIWTTTGELVEKNSQQLVDDLPPSTVGLLLHPGIDPSLLAAATAAWRAGE